MWLQPSLNSGRHLCFYLMDFIFMILFSLIAKSAEKGHFIQQPVLKASPQADTQRSSQQGRSHLKLLHLICMAELRLQLSLRRAGSYDPDNLDGDALDCSTLNLHTNIRTG